MNKKIVVLVVVILLLLGIGGFMFLKKKSSPSFSPEIKKAQQEVMANCAFDADFCKYAANGIVAMASGYTMTSESNYGGKISKMVIKTDGKENSESITYNNGKENGSFISLNKTTYMKNAGETVWTEFPPTKDEAGKPTTNLFDFEGLKKELGNVKDNSKALEASLVVKKIGSETCGSNTCSIFEMVDKTFPDISTKIWVDTSEYYARKMESKTKEGVNTMTFEYGPVTITKPSPVKQMPTFDSTKARGTGVNINSEEIQNLMKNIPQTNTEGVPPTVEATPGE